MIEAPDATDITEDDIGALRLLMDALKSASHFLHVEALEFHAVVNGQKFVVGWGESGDPAILLPRETSDWNGKT